MVSTIRDLDSLELGWVAVSGGEAMLRSDFFSHLLPALGDLSAPVSISSNGTVISQRRAGMLKAAGIASVEISIDGHNAETHRKVRLHKTSFERAICGIRNAVDAGLKVEVTAVVTPYNVDRLVDIAALVANLGVTELNFNTVVEDAGRSRENPNLWMTEESRIHAVQSIRRARAEYPALLVKHSILSEAEAPKTQPPLTCPGGVGVFHISANGDVSPCSWLYKAAPEDFVLGNIKSQSVHDILKRNATVMGPLLEKQDSGCPLPLLR